MELGSAEKRTVECNVLWQVASMTTAAANNVIQQYFLQRQPMLNKAQCSSITYILKHLLSLGLSVS